jgi:TRAP-type mannitol/chloroaromatic compound transport system substrate-binding protein
MARFDELAPPALRRLLSTGTQLRPYSREIMSAAYKASQELYSELGEQNPRFRNIWEHWNKHRLDQTQWFRVAEDSMSNFVAVASASR